MKFLDNICYTITPNIKGFMPMNTSPIGAIGGDSCLYFDHYKTGELNDQQRIFIEPTGEIDTYYLILKSDATESRLLCQPNGSGKYVTSESWRGRSDAKWKIKETKIGSGVFRIENVRTKYKMSWAGTKYFDEKRKDKPVVELVFDSGVSTEFTITICVNDFKTSAGNIVYGATPIIPSSNVVDVFSERKITNTSNAAIMQTLSHTIHKTSSFEWGLEQSVKLGLTVSVEAGIPGIASMKAESSIELGLNAHQTWKETVSEEYTFSETITIQGKGRISVHATIDWLEGASLPYTLQFIVSGNADTKKGNDIALNQQQLKKYLLAHDFQGTILDDTVPNHLTVELKGTFIGSYGVNMVTEVKNLDTVSV